MSLQASWRVQWFLPLFPDQCSEGELQQIYIDMSIRADRYAASYIYYPAVLPRDITGKLCKHCTEAMHMDVQSCMQVWKTILYNTSACIIVEL